MSTHADIPPAKNQPSASEAAGAERVRPLLDLMASRVIAQLFCIAPGIEHLIEWVESKSHKLRGFPTPPRPPENEAPWRAEMRLRAHAITLGTAWVNMALRVNRFDPRVLQREYDKIMEPAKGIAEEINQKAYDRASYNRKRSARLGQHKSGWGEDPEEWKAAIAEALGPAAPPRDDDKSERADLDPDDLKRLRNDLTPAEQEGLDALLSGEPTRGPADRQRRSRAMKKIRARLSQYD